MINLLSQVETVWWASTTMCQLRHKKSYFLIFILYFNKVSQRSMRDDYPFCVFVLCLRA